MAGMTILDFSDREVLFKLADSLNEDGVATSHEVAASSGLDHAEARNVAVRLGWMKRYGVVASAGRRSGERLWTLTPYGRQMLDGILDPEVRQALSGLTESQRVTVMDSLAARAAVGEPVWKTMLRRSWQNKTGRPFV